MIVLDASAVVDVLLDRPAGSWVLHQMRDQRIAAPAHQPAEVLSALARLQRAGVISNGTAIDSCDELMRLDQDLFMPTADHLRRALDLQSRVRVLDGLYVALAEELACPLVTTDKRLAGGELPIEARSPG